MKNIPFDSFYQFLTQQVGIWDTFIVAQEQQRQSRFFAGFDQLALWSYRNEAVYALAKGLNRYFNPDVLDTIETQLIAEALFNIRFLSFIHFKCGERKRGWIHHAFRLTLKLFDRWATEQQHLIAIGNLRYLFGEV